MTSVYRMMNKMIECSQTHLLMVHLSIQWLGHATHPLPFVAYAQNAYVRPGSASAAQVPKTKSAPKNIVPDKSNVSERPKSGHVICRGVRYGALFPLIERLREVLKYHSVKREKACAHLWMRYRHVMNS